MQKTITGILAIVAAVVLLPIVMILALSGGADLGCGTSTDGGPAVSTDGSPTILGTSSMSADQLVTGYLAAGYKATRAEIEPIAATYVSLGVMEGVRGDWAFVQGVVETGGFTSRPWKRDHNPAGIAHYDGQSHGAGFASADDGIKAQIQLLHRYARGNDVQLVTTPVLAPRAGASATTWAELAGRWASDPLYGLTLGSVYRSILAKSGATIATPVAASPTSTTAASSTTTNGADPASSTTTTTIGAGVDASATVNTDCPGLDVPGGAGGAPAGPPSGNIVEASGIRVDSSIAGQVTALIGAAAADGLTLTGSGWRDTARQIELRRQHCGTSHYAIYEMPSGQCKPPTAKPGSSQHERGLAIDFSNCDARATACYRWLNTHAATFGLFNLPSEPWHWSTTGS